MKETGRWVDEYGLVHCLEPDMGYGFTTTGCGFIPYVEFGTIVVNERVTCISCYVKGTFYVR